jgi:hypothetical protein
VKKQDGKPYAWVVQNGEAVQAFVTVRSENPIGFEVDGLAKDAKLIVAPPESLKPGAKVKVKS